MNKKKIILISLVLIDIIIIGIAVMLTINLIKTNKEEMENQNKIENRIENAKTNNVVENKVTNEIKNNTIENKIENTTHTHEEETITDPEQEVDKTTIQKQQTNQEKAINIAKEDWGEDDSVEFTFDHIDENGRYVIFVRELSTTRQIDEYIIDINTGKVVQ